jgi:AAA ATPase domain
MSSDDEEILDRIYNAFNPRPLAPGDPAYVDCRDVRGEVDIVKDLGRSIRRSEELTYKLYSGYRGTGKTTELLRLKDELEAKEFFVVYFAADEEDLSVQDAQYTDILLACTRNLIKQLKNVDPAPIADWLSSRFEDFKDILLSEVKLEKLSIEAQLGLFAKLTTSIRSEPSQRQKIREKVDPHTETLIESLNKFLEDASQKLPEGKKQIVIIVDNLDRIVPIFRDDNGRSNHEEIFLDRHEQLKALKCHIVYTVPISMIYSKWATDLKDNYGIPEVLPSIMVRDERGSIHQAGLDKLKEAICLRIDPVNKVDLTTGIFESSEIVDLLCRMSGGYMRDLIQLMQTSINQVDSLPITRRAVLRAIDELRDIYKRAVEEPQWQYLARVHKVKNINNDNNYRALLFNRCLLEYRYIDSDGRKKTWYDIHPLIEDLPEFKESLKIHDN